MKQVANLKIITLHKTDQRLENLLRDVKRIYRAGNLGDISSIESTIKAIDYYHDFDKRLESVEQAFKTNREQMEAIKAAKDAAELKGV